jgi:hypothetical protein
MLEAVRTSETSVNFNVTARRYIPEDSELHNRRRENLKSHISFCVKLVTEPEGSAASKQISLSVSICASS